MKTNVPHKYLFASHIVSSSPSHTIIFDFYDNSIIIELSDKNLTWRIGGRIGSLIW